MARIGDILILASLLSFSPFASAQAGGSNSVPANWTEYSFAHYGFAVKLPEAPKENGVRDGTQYTLYWNADKEIVLNLTTYHSATDCAAWLANAKKRLSEPPLVPYPVSVLPAPPGGVHWSEYEVTIDGSPAIEGNGARNSMQSGYQRTQCLNGRVYTFEAGFPKGTKKPEIIDQLLKTFHGIETRKTTP